MNIEWSGEGFPPVGAEIKFWVDERSEYKKGIVVYSGKKGATVDIGYLASSGETGDFSLITAQDRKEEVAIAAMKQLNIGDYSDPQIIYDAIAAGKIPGIRLTDDAGS
ncbi:hypothetical protein [Erwinia sp. 9145]|uniref:hypothetical protein n=1 Tax=Erwinia sp. 9145 TaxID=1500895 RepID=UPI000551D758|nr:hypothetical protein [Erwinia sp. 9145]